MTRTTPVRLLAASAAVLTLGAGLAACGSSDGDHDMGSMSTPIPSGPVPSSAMTSSPMPSSPMPSSPMPSGRSSSSPAASTPATGSAEGTPAAGAHDQADVMFATMMVPHHRDAVAMCDLLLAKGGIDGSTRDLARRIRATQSPEITRMSGWLAGWGQDPSPSSMGGDMGGDMGGAMSTADRHDLEVATGARATQLFLTDMVGHHQGAVEMARSELADGQNPEAKQLARSIQTSQQAEIAEMRKLLSR